MLAHHRLCARQRAIEAALTLRSAPHEEELVADVAVAGQAQRVAAVDEDGQVLRV